MPNDEKLVHLARVVVRTGERYNLAGVEWSEELREFEANLLEIMGSEDDLKHLTDHGFNLRGRISAVGGLSHELRADIETLMSVNDLYTLAGEEPPISEPKDELEHLRRELKDSRDEIESLKIELGRA